MAASTGPLNEGAGGMPEGAELEGYLRRRNRSGRIWLALFQAAIILAILALFALLYNIINGSFGLVAVENVRDPVDLVMEIEEAKMLAAPNVTASEDDEVIAASVAADPNGLGFFGYAYYQEHADTLNALRVDGIAPNAATVESGDYPLARPLYIYVNRAALRGRPQVAAFVQHYIENVNSEVGGVGYFPLTAEAQEKNRAAFAAALGDTPVDADAGDIAIAGSSTVFPLTERMGSTFAAATGFAGEFDNEAVGTKEGIARLCDAQDVDIAAASRALTGAEVAACQELGVKLVAFRVGSDAIAVVTNKQNSAVTDVSSAELAALFQTAQTWAEVNPAWLDAPVARTIPGAASGTLDFFASAVYDKPLAELSKEEQIVLLERYVSKGVMRRIDREEPLAERPEEEIHALLQERVVEPQVVASWNLTPSLFGRQAIEAQLLEEYPTANLEWRRWLNTNFLLSTQSSTPELAGVRTAILGSLWVVLITMLVAVPVGIGAAIYLEEYARRSRLNQFIQTNIDNLAGVPSIIYGILGLTVFVRFLEQITSGAAFGVGDATTANGRTILSAGLTLALLVLPLVIINAQEAIRAVPRSLREAGFGLGATKWQVTWTHVLGNALPGIFTGTILAMSRALGETAPLIVVGASTFITQDPSNPFAKFTVLPMQIFQWTTRPQLEFKHIAAAAGLVLLILLLLLNGTAIFLRNRYSKKL